MRAALPALVLSFLVMSAQPGAVAPAPLLPGMSLSLEPATASANLSQNKSASVKFNGTVDVSENRASSMNVQLTAAVDTGWPASCSPGNLSFQGSTSQKFDCTVTIPGNATNSSATLVVTAKGQTRFFIVTNTASAAISLTIKNQTLPANRTKPQGAGSGGSSGGGKIAGMDPLVLGLVVAAVVAAGGGAGAFMILRRRRARLPAAAA